LSRNLLPAAEVALDVLRWADDGGSTPLKKRAFFELGDDPGIEALFDPPPALLEAACSVAERHFVRVGFDHPLFHDTRPISYGPFLLAFSVGIAASPAKAERVAEACPGEGSFWDFLLRDAIVCPALSASIEETLADSLRLRSPYSALRNRPAPGREDEAMALISRLRETSAGGLLLFPFMTPHAPPDVRRFRARVLDRERLLGEEGQRRVLEFYQFAFVRHHEEMTAALEDAYEALAEQGAEAEAIQDALALAMFFGPLARIQRSAPDLLRRYVHLDIESVLLAIRLFRLGERIAPEAL